MTSADDCRRQAAECLRIADHTKEPEAKALLETMADAWIRLAHDREAREARKSR